MRTPILAGLVALCLAADLRAGAATAGPQPATAYQPVQFGRLIVGLKAGNRWYVEMTGPFGCSGVLRHREADGANEDLKLPAARQEFLDEFARAGLKVSVKDALFETPAQENPDFVISGVVTALHVRVCDQPRFKGGGYETDTEMAIEWRLYSQPLKRVVATTHTSAVRKLNGHDLKLETVLNDAFVDSLRQLALAAPIRAALAAPSQAKAESVLPAAQPSITLAGSLAAPPRGMSTAADSVVLVLVAEGHGSGFLVSKDGYFLTDAHVVESAKTVKIRWSDGVTDEAQVVRVDKGRDVALLKADPRGHAPLALRPQMPDVGETVFAIGAPLDKNLQGTVMRGIVSAHRVKDGYDLLQSDVAANMGMSGGPLLDAQGRVVALVESGYQPTAEVQVGINYFTPVGDALKYLSLAPQ